MSSQVTLNDLTANSFTGIGSGLTSLNLDNAGSGTLAGGRGGTGLASYAVGDFIYASGTTTLAKLADVAAGSVIVSGGVGVAPAWSATPDITGISHTSGTFTITGPNGQVIVVASSGLSLANTSNGIFVQSNLAQVGPSHIFRYGSSNITGAADLGFSRDSAGVFSLNDADATQNTTFAIQAKSTTTNKRDRFRIATAAQDNTDASRKYRAIFSAYDTAARECMRLEASGSAAMIGFLGATAVARAGATDDIKDALTNYGFLQGTSATPLNLDGGALTAGSVIATNFPLAASEPADGTLVNGSVIFWIDIGGDRLGVKVKDSGGDIFVGEIGILPV